MKYAHWDGLNWQIETVDSDVSGHNSSLSLDSSGRPHITFDQLKYAYWDGLSWQIETVENIGSTYKASLALDSHDHAYIGYLAGTDRQLMAAYWDGMNWQSEVITDEWDGGRTSIAVDSQDRPQISYIDLTKEVLKYAEWDGLNWQVETVDSANLDNKKEQPSSWCKLSSQLLSLYHPIYCTVIGSSYDEIVTQFAADDSQALAGVSKQIAIRTVYWPGSGILI